MAFQVFLTADAVVDLEDLHAWILAEDGPVRSRHVVQQFEAVFESLTENPQRGARPTELLDLGIRDYREVFFKPYRVIYRVVDKVVYVMLIVDGRRDLQSLLERRLLRP